MSAYKNSIQLSVDFNLKSAFDNNDSDIDNTI
jgi:hypothetical protein